jgi:hypothetical protein
MRQLPAIRVTISGGSDSHIRITDRGGGIPPQVLKKKVMEKIIKKTPIEQP